MFSKVLVANRGEIAVRVVRACAELGIASAVVHSTADAGALFVRLADEAVELPGDTAEETYLDVAAVVSAAVATGAQAVHPGYGFLAESAQLAAAVADAGLVFVGPPADAIAVMGEKTSARRVAASVGVPHVPGTRQPVADTAEIAAFGDEHGYPVLVKAAHGGGGRGMRTVQSVADAADALRAATAEAAASFGNGDVYLERFLPDARHVEVQLLADRHGNVAALGDRDCSVQRRHQKLIEEAPAPGLPDRLRAEMAEAAVRLAKAVDYVGAGTVEFLVDGDQFYFLEMNTRIQVEHPVTELVAGVDLVHEQLGIAAGEPLGVSTAHEPRGHAIECRLNAEDVTEGRFLPAPGRIERLSVPTLPGVRFDTGYEAGDELSPRYDSLVGKLIVWGPDRATAVHRTVDALRATDVAGVPTTIPAALAVLTHSDFAAGGVGTRWLTEHLAILPGTDAPEEPVDDEPTTDSELWVGGRRYVVPYLGEHAATARRPRRAARGGGRHDRHGASRTASGGPVQSPVQGTVVTVAVEPGDTVAAGQLLLVVEAMKMENPVHADTGGRVEQVHVQPGSVVAAGDVLAVLDVDGAGR